MRFLALLFIALLFIALLFIALLFIALLFIALLAPAPVFAGPLEDGKAAYDSQDFPTAMQYLQPLADQGNAEAQWRIGEIYEDGWGIKQDMVEALKWYRKAAEQGSRGSYGYLGLMYDKGAGVRQDYEEAYFWYSLAAYPDFTSTLAREYAGSHLTSEQNLSVEKRIKEWERTHPPFPFSPKLHRMTPDEQAQIEEAKKLWKKPPVPDTSPSCKTREECTCINEKDSQLEHFSIN